MLTTRLGLGCTLGLAALLLAVGCESDDSTTTNPTGNSTGGVCEQAAAHVAACLGETSIGTTSACDADASQAVLDQDCTQIVAGLDAAKSDGYGDYWNSYLCGWWGVGCSGAGSSSGAGTIEVSSDRSIEDLVLFGATETIRCGHVLVENSAGEVVGDVFTTPSGRATIEDLELGRYTVTMLGRDGERLGSREVEVENNREAWAYLTVPAESEQVDHCVVGRGYVEVDTCGDKAAAPSREWAVTIEPNEDTQIIADVFYEYWNNTLNPSEPRRIFNGDLFFTYVPMGEYIVTFWRIDLPEGNNIDVQAELDSSFNESFEAESFLVRFDESGLTGEVELGSFPVTDPSVECETTE